MSYNEFITFIYSIFGNISEEECEKLWQVYENAKDNEEIKTIGQEEVLKENLIYIYQHLKKLDVISYDKLLYGLNDLYSLISTLILLNYDEEIFPQTYQLIEKELQDIIKDSVFTEEMKKICQNYVNEKIEYCKKEYYRVDNVRDSFYQAISINITRNFPSSIVDQILSNCMQIYHRLICIDILDNVPNYVIKSAIISTFNDENDLLLSYQQRFNMSLGLSHMKLINTFEEANDYLMRFFENDMIQDCYKDVYLCFGILNCIDWDEYSIEEKQNCDFLKGEKYFKEEEFSDKIYETARNIYDFWCDDEIKEHTSDFQLGILSRGSFLYNVFSNDETVYVQDNFYTTLCQLIDYDNIECELKIVDNLIEELIRLNETKKELKNPEEMIKESILSSYQFLSGDVRYEERRNSTLAFLYVGTMYNEYINKGFTMEEFVADIEFLKENYVDSKFLGGIYQDSKILDYIENTIENMRYDINNASSYAEDLQKNLYSVFLSSCETKEELEKEKEVANKLCQNIVEVISKIDIPFSKEDGIESIYNSYFILPNDHGKLLSYDERLSFIEGNLLSKYMSNDISRLSLEIYNIFAYNKLTTFKRDCYFLYGLLLSILEKYELKVQKDNVSYPVWLGMNYINVSLEEDLIMNIVHNIIEYYYDDMQKEKSSEFIEGIIYGVFAFFNEKEEEYTKQNVKKILN